MSTPKTTNRVSFGTKLWSLRWSLLLSIALGMVLVFLTLFETGKVSFESLIWVVIICVALTMGKTFFHEHEIIVAAFGFAGILLAKLLTEPSIVEHGVVDIVRAFLYPVLGWTVARLEKTEHDGLANTLEQWLFPVVVLPLTAGLILAVTDNPPVKALAEVIFSSGCALILHAQKIPLAIDPLVNIVSALIIGAVAASKTTVDQAIQDAHASLKGLIARKLGTGPHADDIQAALRIVEKKPSDKARQKLLHEELKVAKVQEDAEVVKGAQTVLELARQHEPAIVRKYESL